MEDRGRETGFDRLKDALRLVSDEPNIDKARKIADAVLMPNARNHGLPEGSPVD